MSNEQFARDHAALIASQREKLLTEFTRAAMQGLCSAIPYGAGVFISYVEIADDALGVANATLTALSNHFSDAS